jgi:tetratricopeptide (TPR) repeat protein
MRITRSHARPQLLYRCWSVVAVACVFSVAASPRADGVSELDDAAARMQYAFHTGDIRGVEEAISVVQKVALPVSLKGMKEYFSAYGQWKLAELHADAAASGRRDERSAASKAAATCARLAQEATRIDATLAEGFAIEAICSVSPARATEVFSSGDCSKHRSLRAAQELAPTNPRVMLIEAQCSVATDKTGSQASIERLRRVVRAFDTARPSRPGQSDWGYAEALVLLGEAHLQAGDSVAARDAIERALVIAPDYRKAREMLVKPPTRSTQTP